MTPAEAPRSPHAPSAAKPVRNGLILLIMAYLLWLYSGGMVLQDGGAGTASSTVLVLAACCGIIGLWCLAVGVVRAVRKIDDLHGVYVDARGVPGTATAPNEGRNG